MNASWEISPIIPTEYELHGMRLAHSLRFRRVSTRYPLRVTEAFGGDIALAMSLNDVEVEDVVAAWEREQGWTPTDWHAVGAEERDEESPST